jgi:hypothetical protein
MTSRVRQSADYRGIDAWIRCSSANAERIRESSIAVLDVNLSRDKKAFRRSSAVIEVNPPRKNGWDQTKFGLEDERVGVRVT